MTILRHQLPARSPVTGYAIWRGLRALGGEGRLRRAREAVEAILRSRYPRARVTLTDSGTAALTIALHSRPCGAHAAVALPAYGCFDLATAVDATGLPFVFYDIDPTTLAPDVASVKRAIAAGADRVVVAHHYGIPVDLEGLRTDALQAGELLIDDAAQGDGGSSHGIALGAAGDLGVLSFGRGKGTTGGGGGALLDFQTSTDAYDAALGGAAGWTSTRQVGALLAQWLLGRPALYWMPAALPFVGLGETTYRRPRPATAPTAFSLGVLATTLGSTAAESATRRANAAFLLRMLDGLGFATPHLVDDAIPGFLRLPAIAPPEVAREVRRGNGRRLGIMPGYPLALCDLTGFGERRGNPDEVLPGARLLAERLITFPTHGALSSRDLASIARWCAAAAGDS